MKGVIYKYTFPDGKVYIGQTRRDPEKRHQEHLDPIIGPTNSGFWKAYQQFGTYKYEIVKTFECERVDDLIERLNYEETKLIISSKAYDEKYGYNKRVVGCAHSDKSRILATYRKELLEPLFQERLGMFFTIKHKLYESHDYLTEKEKKYFQKVKSRTVCHRMPEKFKNINKVIKCERVMNDFWFSEFMEELEYWLINDITNEIDEHIKENENEIIDFYRDQHSICQLDEEGKVLATYDTFEAAAIGVGKTTCSSIRSAIKGKLKHVYGYRWKYKKDL